jgi:hypothetical protein
LFAIEICDACCKENILIPYPSRFAPFFFACFKRGNCWRERGEKRENGNLV